MRARIRVLAITPVVALAMTACPSPEPAPTPQPPAEPPDPFALTQQCTNPDGFTVSYPQGWLTNEETENQLPPCSLFDPDSVALDDAMHVPEDIAVFIQIELTSFEAAVDPMFEEELDRREVTVDEREALRIETRATGEGFYDEGTLTVSYRVPVDDDRTLIARVHNVGEPDYLTKQEVLDAIMGALRIAPDA